VARLQNQHNGRLQSREQCIIHFQQYVAFIFDNTWRGNFSSKYAIDVLSEAIIILNVTVSMLCTYEQGLRNCAKRFSTK
jgi:hypothetical protein